MDAKHLTAYVVFFIIVSNTLIIYALTKDYGLFNDESAHYSQIRDFVRGSSVLHCLSTLPGYHAVMAFLATFFADSSRSFVRFLNVVFSILSVFVFYLCAKTVHNKSSVEKTIQFWLLPLLFPYFFLIYTDVLSLWFILLMMLLLLKKRFQIAALSGIMACLVRQNNVVWLAFAIVFIWGEEFSFRKDLHSLNCLLQKCLLFVFGILSIVFYLVVNGHLVPCRPELHPLTFSLGNVYMALFLLCIFYLPIHVANARKIYSLLQDHKIHLIYLILFCGFFVFPFVSINPQNNNGQDWVLMNYLLGQLKSSIILRALLCIPIAYVILSLFVIKLMKPVYRLFFIFSFLFLAASWFVEPRYYIIPFSMFILFRRPKGPVVEYFAIFFSLILSIALFSLVSFYSIVL